MFSEQYVINLALQKMEQPIVADENEESQNYKDLKYFAPLARRQTLSEAQWRQLQSETAFEQFKDSVVENRGYFYIRPDNCIRVLKAKDSCGNAVSFSPYIHPVLEIKLIRTEQPIALFKFVRDTESYGVFNELIITAIANKLVEISADKILVSSDKAASKKRDAKRDFRMFVAAQASEEKPNKIDRSDPYNHWDHINVR